MNTIKNKFVRGLLFSFGIISLILGIVGIFLPLLPTTPFVLLAAWCFMKSSPRTHNWIYAHPLFGKVLINWDEKKAISRPTKIIAVLMIISSLTLIWLKVHILEVKIAVSILLTVTSAFIITRAEP
ncbi:MAG: YbaN family protein [Pseudobdellovibrio sp.]